MVFDIMLLLAVTVLGGVLGLVVEFLIYLYPIYLAVVLLVAAQCLNLLGKIIKLTGRFAVR